MKAVTAVVLAALVAATGFAGPAKANNHQKCAEGQVTLLKFVGFNDRGHDPTVRFVINGQEYYIGLSSESAKAQMALTQMRSILLSAMLSGITAEFWSIGGCGTPTENQVEVRARVLPN